jgi:hypothetical protein
MRARAFGEVDRAVIEHAVEHVEILDQMAVPQDLDQAVGNDREYDVGRFAELAEQRIGAQPLLTGRIGDDAEDDLALLGKGRQVVLRQHRADVVAQEVADVFLAPDDAPHGEDVDARVLLAVGRASRLAGRELHGAVVEEGLDLGTEGQVAGRSRETAKLVEQAKAQEVHPDAVERLVVEGRARVGGLRAGDLLAKRVELLLGLGDAPFAHFEGNDRVRFVGKLKQSGVGGGLLNRRRRLVGRRCRRSERLCDQALEKARDVGPERYLPALLSAVRLPSHCCCLIRPCWISRMTVFKS